MKPRHLGNSWADVLVAVDVFVDPGVVVYDGGVETRHTSGAPGTCLLRHDPCQLHLTSLLTEQDTTLQGLVTLRGRACLENNNVNLKPGKGNGYTEDASWAVTAGIPVKFQMPDRDSKLVAQNALMPMAEKGLPLPPEFSVLLIKI